MEDSSVKSDATYLIDYCQTVLGLRFVPQFERSIPKLTIIDLPSPGGLANVEMFQKMMTAIGFKKADFEVIESLPSELTHWSEKLDEANNILSFSDELSEQITQKEKLTTLKGPRDLLENPNLKRQTWTGLQDLSRKI